MTKTKAKLRAEAVERLRELNAYVDGPESIVDKLAYGLDTDRFNYHVEIEHIIDLLTDDCGPCYSCARLAELMAENSVLHVQLDGMTRIDQDERLPRLADAETRVRELQAKVDELTAERSEIAELVGWHGEVDENGGEPLLVPMVAAMCEGSEVAAELIAENSALRALIADIRKEIRPVENDVFLIGYIDRKISECGIDVSRDSES